MPNHGQNDLLDDLESEETVSEELESDDSVEFMVAEQEINGAGVNMRTVLDYSGPSLMDGVAVTNNVQDGALDAWNEHVSQVELVADRFMEGDYSGSFSLCVLVKLLVLMCLVCPHSLLSLDMLCVKCLPSVLCHHSTIRWIFISSFKMCS